MGSIHYLQSVGRNILLRGVFKKEVVINYNKIPAAFYVNKNNARNIHASQNTTSRTFITKTVEPDGLFRKVLKKVGFNGSSKSRLKISSILLYENVADNINYISFFERYNMPNTFNSWFLVTELHVWMLLVRAMGEGSETGEDGRFLRNSIVEAMWADVNTRAKKLGANNPSGTRAQIQVLSEQFQAALLAYDEGIMSEDRVLASSLWRRFFERNTLNYTQIEDLVKYVRCQVKMLDAISSENLLIKPKILWVPFEKL